MAATPLCGCGSGLPEADCHSLLLSERHVEDPPREYFFTPPAHVPHERLRDLTARLSREAGYPSRLAADGRIAIRSLPPIQLFQHRPVARPAPSEVRFVPPPP